MKVGLIGAGAWGKNLARNFIELGALHALCDFNQDVLSNYPDIKTTTSDKEILDDPSLDAIAIAAPVKEHYWLARAALERGKDVLVEKPLCFSVGEAEELSRLAHEKGRVLMVGHILRYHTAVERLLSLVEEGQLGEIRYITANRLSLGKIWSLENALWDFAPHDLSVILALMGGELPVEVRCTGGDYLQEGIADMTLTTMRWENGVRAQVHVSWLNPFKEQRLTVVGSEAMAVFDDRRAEKLTLLRQPVVWKGVKPLANTEAVEEVIEIAAAEPLRCECEHFIACCEERRRPLTDGEEATRVVRVLSAAQASLEGEGAAKIPGVRPPLRPKTFPQPAIVFD